LKPVPLNGSRKQVALNCCDLLLDHAVKIQLTAARKGQVFSRVDEWLRMRAVFKCSHEHDQGG
jgi:hypothetical protein